jgi:WD40 repeat protein
MFSALAAKQTDIHTDNADWFSRHRGPITCACPIPDSQTVVTSGYDGAVGLFDTQTDEVELLGYHAHLVNRVSVDSQGRFAASCSSDFNICIWDLETRQLTKTLRGHSDDVEDFVFIDDERGASVSRDWRVLVWNLKSGAIEHTFLGHAQDVLSVNYFDGKLYTSGDDMTLRIWDLLERKLVKTLGPFDTEADTCAIDPIHQRAVLGCDDGYIRIFNIESGDLTASIKAHEAGIKNVACSPKNGDILSAAYDQRVLVWDAASLELKKELHHQPGTWERSFNWSNDGQFVYAGTFNGTVLKWASDTGSCLNEFGVETDANGNAVGNACFNDVAIIDTDSIAAVSDDGLIRVGTLSENKAAWQHTHSPETGRVLMNAITTQYSRKQPNGIQSFEVIVGTHEQSLQCYDVDPSGLNQTLSVNLYKGPINCIRVAHHDGYQGQYFVAGYTGAVMRVDQNGSTLKEINVHDNAVKALALHPTQPIGVSCSADGVLASWDFDGELLHLFPGHLAIIDDVDISPDGTYVASAGRDFSLKIHRLSDGALLQSIGLGKRSPKALAFISNDVVIVTNYWGELLRVDLRDGSVIQKTIAENGISGIAIKGDQIVASSYDGGIYLVQQSDLKTINVLRSMTQRVNSPAYVD